MSNFLIGKTIKDFKVAEDKKALLFVTEDGEAVVKVDGDCCSNSWVEHIELPAMGFPAKVISVDDLDLPGSTNDDENFECLAVYGCKIETDKGVIIIDYRNESNGYYGGNLSWPDDTCFYGGVHEQNVSNEQWVDIAI